MGLDGLLAGFVALLLCFFVLHCDFPKVETNGQL